MNTTSPRRSTLQEEKKMDVLQQDIENIRNNMTNSIQYTLQRSQDIEDLEKKTTGLALSAKQFHRKAKKTKLQKCQENSCSYCLQGFIFLLFLAIVIMFFFSS